MKSNNTLYVRKVREALRKSGLQDSFTDLCSYGYRMKISPPLYYNFIEQYNQKFKSIRSAEHFKNYFDKNREKIQNQELRKMERWVKDQHFNFHVKVVIRGMNPYICLLVPKYDY